MTGLVLAAAGTGSRFGTSIPKQFLRVDDKALYLKALEAFDGFVDETVVVVPARWERKVQRELKGRTFKSEVYVEVGGESRQGSVYRGLSRLHEEIEIVLVHDAARPFVTPPLIRRVLEGTRRFGACIPAIPLSDTVKEVKGDVVVRTLDRSLYFSVQTPQGFQLSLLKKAFLLAVADGLETTDESSLVERIGFEVHVTSGSRENIKVTWRQDLDFKRNER